MKLFVLLSRFPYPVEKGDKLRAFHQLRCLAVKHEIILCALSEHSVSADDVARLKEFCSEVHIMRLSRFGLPFNAFRALLTGIPFQVGYFYRYSAMQQIRKLITQTNPDHIYCQLIRTAEYVKHINIPKTIDFQDVFSIGSKRRAQISKGIMRWFFMMEYQRLVKYEKTMFDLFDNHTIISEPDRELLPHSNRQSVAIIPNGVDFNFFTPIKNAKKYHIVFTGNMGYPPNIDAARFLANEILPVVKKTIPDISLLIAGATPHTRVSELQSENIHVSGWMPDIRDAYSSATIFIAPMRIGTGLQNKLLEAMAMQIPCITSEMANQALGAKSGFEILVGNSTGEFATHIINLLNDKDLAVRIAENGRQFVNSNYDWAAATQKLEHIFE